MPVMDGYEATGLLRQEGYTDLIIALTSQGVQPSRPPGLGRPSWLDRVG